jgi:3-oxoacyl-[acyl-carrier-protein] synthase-3
MGKACFSKTRIAGISCAVPTNKTTVYEAGAAYFTKEFIDRIHDSVGTETFYYCGANQSSGDLGIAAAEDLIESLQWDRDSIGALIFNSQTRDFIVPPTSARLQFELGLPNGAFVADTAYGCPAYSMGLVMASQLIETGQCERVLLINAECHSKAVNKEDGGSVLIFGDAAAATAIERTAEPSPSFFSYYVDGQYFRDLFIRGFKDVPNEANANHDLGYMNGESVTRFMMKEAPHICDELIAMSGYRREEIDVVYMHQANAFINRFMAKRIKFPPEKMPINIGRFGNTSGVSIPLLIADEGGSLFEGATQRALLLGFGAGFMISGAILDIGGLKGGHIVPAASEAPPEFLQSNLRFAADPV